MAQNVAGNTYEFEIVVPEFAEDAPEEAKAIAFFAVAFLGETIKGSTIAFGTDGAVVMCKQEGAKQTKMTGSYAQEGERLTVRGIPDCRRLRAERSRRRDGQAAPALQKDLTAWKPSPRRRLFRAPQGGRYKMLCLCGGVSAQAKFFREKA